MDKNYYIIYAYNTISLETSKALSKLGAIVPYDSFNTDINCYLYLTKEQIDDIRLFKQIKAIIGDYQILPNTTTLSEINKNLDKITTDNKLSLGETVTHQLYKKLPFTVTYLDNETAIIFHKLKHKDLALEVDAKEITKATETNQTLLYLEQNQSYKVTQDYSNIVIIDCDMFSSSSTYNLVNIITLLKILYTDKTIIVCNPDHNQEHLCKTLKLTYITGTMWDILEYYFKQGSQFIIVSNSSTIEYIFNSRYQQTDNQFYNYDGIIELQPKVTQDNLLTLAIEATRETIGKTLDPNYIIHKCKSAPLSQVDKKTDRFITAVNNHKYQEPRMYIPDELTIKSQEVEKTLTDCRSWHLSQISQSLVDILTGAI